MKKTSLLFLFCLGMIATMYSQTQNEFVLEDYPSASNTIQSACKEDGHKLATIEFFTAIRNVDFETVSNNRIVSKEYDEKRGCYIICLRGVDRDWRYIQIDISKYGFISYQMKAIQIKNGEYLAYKLSPKESGYSQGLDSHSDNGSRSNEDKRYNTRSFSVNGVTFDMVYVGNGTFLMGSDYSFRRWDYYDEEWPIHQVILDSYYIGQTEVTQQLWNAVMDEKPNGNSVEESDLPVKDISWNDCQRFITTLNQLTGKNFRLPTEAEWEFAARGGRISKHHEYSGSNNYYEVAWCVDNSGLEIHPVKMKSANELGIYDMSGNLWEWCNDWFGEYSNGSFTNPTGPSTGTERVKRGGGANSGEWDCRVSARSAASPQEYGDIGLRLVISDKDLDNRIIRTTRW